MIRLVLFDIDSTLLIDGGAAGRAYDHAFKELFDILPAAVDKHGKTDPNITREIARATFGRELEPDEEKRLHSRYCELFPAYLETSGSFRVLRGAWELCAELNGNPSFALGIQTGNIEPCADVKLRRARLDSFFRFGGFGSDAADRTILVSKAIERGKAVTGYDCRKNDVIVIGDSPHDIIAGKCNGAFTIGVTTGKSTAVELAAAGANAVIPDLSETSVLREILYELSQ
jgi:phosphoglycolate phosphatase